MSKYAKQTWNDFDKSLSLEENIKRNAVVTGNNMNHIESGIQTISSSVELLETANKEITEAVENIQSTLGNIPSDLQTYLETIQSQNQSILREIEDIKTQIKNIQTNSVDDLTLTGNKLQVSASGVPLGEGVDVVTPSLDDEALDGVPDGVVNVDDIVY